MESNNNMDEVVHKCMNIINNSKIDVKSCEVYYNKTNYIKIEIEENSIKNNEMGTHFGISVRTLSNNGSLGFAYTNNLEESSIEKMVNNSLKLMKSGTPDPEFLDLPKEYKKYPKIKNLFDEKVQNFHLEEFLNHADQLIEICKSDEKAISQSAKLSAVSSSTLITNSNGLRAELDESSCSVSSNMIVKEKSSGETAFGYDWQAVRKFSDLDSQEVGKNALTDAKTNLNRKKIRSKTLPVILSPKATINFILSPIAGAVNAESFQYNRSFLVGKRGEKIGNELLTIRDNALIDGSVGSTPFDDEGVPGKNKLIIKKGKFLEKGLLHNSYTASKEGVESTGNGFRGSYKSLPSIDTTNLILEPGDRSKDEMIKEIKEGIFLGYTGDRPNISTGDFSGLIMHGNSIINGEIENPLNETMFGINLLELFKKIESISKEFKIIGSYQAPYVKLKDVRIIGSQ